MGIDVIAAGHAERELNRDGLSRGNSYGRDRRKGDALRGAGLGGAEDLILREHRSRTEQKGEDEVEIARHADGTVLLLVPGMGDDVQTFKAGVMEIADLYVVNKSDRPGADRVEQEVTAMLGMSQRRDDWRPPVLKTVATTGEGISDLREALERFRTIGQQDARQLARRREQWRGSLLELLRQSLFEFALSGLDEAALNACVEDVLTRRRDPHTVADELVSDFRRGKGAAGKR